MLPPFTRIYRFRIVFFTVSAITLLSESSRAQSTRYSSESVYQSQVAGVPFQPFLVAYYTPRTFRPRRPAYDNESPVSNASIEQSGAHPTVSGNRAVIRHGVAYAPSNAPDSVKNAIWAVNSICNRPYVWGGGHGSFHDSGYDCSGTVSYALHYAGALNQPLASSELTRFGERGHGRWITVYSRHGHTFAVIAGLRLDTTDFRYGGDVGPRWHEDGRDTWGFEARHPAKL